MELYQLTYFLAVAQRGSFTAAANGLNISQPSLSTAIKKLENELKTPLFVRRWRGVQLTPAGDVFREKAQTILSEYESALASLRDFQARPTLKIGVMCTLQISVISRILKAFRRLYPEIIVELHDTAIDELDRWLHQGVVDIIITALDQSADPQTTQSLFEQSLLLGVPLNHPFAQRDQVQLTELHEQPYIDRIKCEILSKMSPSIFEMAGIQPNIVYRADHEEWVIELIRAELGVSIMPQWQVPLGITYIPLAGMQPQRRIGLQWNHQARVEVVNLFRMFAAEQNWDG
ncbi:LysR family transcriptional regulator [filamentous cyanobacterium LEGE 11480]|uniref:LysR family transcriptional regulator n=1 Tax=Romeriopsis navalis LEGE 11480 TaxID=2777977 RepID=A0A928VJ07_9CYAN|nr:LysR family transcriptional regulator [Romeriopsis navalis LEGE 11480]